MKLITARIAIAAAIAPARIESRPRSGPTVRSSIAFSLTGSLPEDSEMASSLAVSTVKPPLICAVPPRIGSLILGADSTLLSRMMAKGLPVLSVVARPKRRAPWLSKRMVTTGAPDCGSKACAADAICSPETMARRWTAIAPEPSAIGRIWLPGGARPCATCAGSACWSTSLNSSRAVWPIRRFRLSGSSMPGTCTRMRLVPWLMTVTSRVPEGSMRRRTTSRATVIASLIACASPSWVGVRRTRLPSCVLTSQARVPVRPTGGTSVRIRSTAASSCEGSRSMKLTRPLAVETSPTCSRGSRRSSVWTLSSIPASRWREASARSAS